MILENRCQCGPICEIASARGAHHLVQLYQPFRRADIDPNALMVFAKDPLPSHLLAQQGSQFGGQ